MERRIPCVRQDFFRGEQRLEQAGFEETATFEQIVWDPVSFDRARVRELFSSVAIRVTARWTNGWPSSTIPSSPTARWTASLTAPPDPSSSARASGRQCSEPAEGQAGSSESAASPDSPLWRRSGPRRPACPLRKGLARTTLMP